MKYWQRNGLVQTCLLICLLVMSPSAQASQEGAREFARQLADNALTILQNDELSAKGKQSRLRDLFADRADLKWVARFVLGKHWRSANETQRREYLKYYREFILKNFTERLIEFTGQEYTITQVRQDGEPNEYRLTLELKRSGEPNVMVDYRLREKLGKYYIFDIIIEGGVSLITTQRSEFNSVISRKGLDFLIEALKKRAADA